MEAQIMIIMTLLWAWNGKQANLKTGDLAFKSKFVFQITESFVQYFYIKTLTRNFLKTIFAVSAEVTQNPCFDYEV